MKPARRVLLLLLIILATALVIALIAAGCAPTSPPAGCARLAFFHSEAPAAGIRQEGLDRKAFGEVIVCDQVSIGPLPAGTLFVDLKAVGSPDDLRAEAGGDTPAEASTTSGGRSPMAEKLLPWLIGAGALLVAALFALVVGALLFPRKVSSALVILLAALALPALAEAQPRPGVGLSPMPGASITFAFNADGRCPAASLVTAIDPWALIGDPGALTPSAGVSAATHGPLAAAFRDAWCRRYGGKGAAPCLCPLRGVGGDPHGQTCRPRLEAAFARGLLGAAGEWSGVPNERELDDCIHSEGVWRWVSERLGIVIGGGANCPAGWRCTPLVDLPASERPGAVANGRAVKLKVTAPNGDGCSFFHLSGASVYVPNRPACFAGLPANCQTAASLRAECWSAPEPEPPVEPPAPAVALEILDCDPTGWRVRTAAGEDRVSLGAEVTVGGVTVRLPVACSGACPAAEILERACKEVRQ